eukprot:m.18957 g.18957  ORF g.18957 m.18957 type:complete len:117 (-) comp3644_c0_seq1:126-476(-)
MPLVKIFASGSALAASVARAAVAVHPLWCTLWKVDSDVLQIMSSKVDIIAPNNDIVVVDVRAKSKVDRTVQELDKISAEMTRSLNEAGVLSDIKVRIELFEPDNKYYSKSFSAPKL